ncbi:hypothetical protein ACA910_015957 [Epithemia clementina (nom. ined.)]
MHTTGRYQAEFFVILPPPLANTKCAQTLEKAGFALMPVELPVVPADIPVWHDPLRNESLSTLQSRISRDGCCGHLELLKLYSFKMTNHSVAVHIDLDTLVTQPLDELLDAIYCPPESEQGIQARRHLLQEGIVAPTYQPVVPVMNMTIDAFFTKDYNMVPAGKHSRVGMQGGFLVVRPNATRYQELVDMVKTGYFRPGRDLRNSGWFGSGYGLHIWGAMSIQVLLAYYFDVVTKDSAIELHRCKFNQIVDNPRRSSHHHLYARWSPLYPANASWHDTTCRDGRPNCDDVQCQSWPIHDTRMVHYSYCKMPWRCAPISPGIEGDTYLREANCREIYKLWFDVRKQVRGTENLSESDGLQPDIYGGFCNSKSQYVAIQGVPRIDDSTSIRAQ